MWTTVYIATGHQWALEVKKLLEEEGFIIKMEYIGIEDGEKIYEILGPRFEAEDIQKAILELRIM